MGAAFVSVTFNAVYLPGPDARRPPFYASSTSPSTPSIPPTTPSTDYPVSPIYFAPLSRPSMARSRSGSLASMKTYISASPTLNFNPVVLPIGQKVPKWREAPHWLDTDDDRQIESQSTLGAPTCCPPRISDIDVSKS